VIWFEFIGHEVEIYNYLFERYFLDPKKLVQLTLNCPDFSVRSSMMVILMKIVRV